MRNSDCSQPDTYPALPCSVIVYRAVLSSRHRDKVTGRIVSGAFMRRPPKTDGTIRDAAGLSVSIFQNPILSQQNIIERVTTQVTCFAIASLHVGHIRDVPATPKLDVVQDALTHANITGLPTNGENDIEAERLATALVNQARTIWYK